MFVFLLQALAEILRADVARFAGTQIASCLLAKRNEARMREAENHAFAIHHKLAVHRIGVPRGYGVPAVRKAAFVNEVCHLRRNIERAHKLAHRSGIRNGWIQCSRHGSPTFLRLPPQAAKNADMSGSPRQLPRPREPNGPDRAILFPAPPGIAEHSASGSNSPSNRCATFYP